MANPLLIPLKRYIRQSTRRNLIDRLNNNTSNRRIVNGLKTKEDILAKYSDPSGDNTVDDKPTIVADVKDRRYERLKFAPEENIPEEETYWNTEQVAYCPEGYQGDPVVVTANSFSSTVSQEDANNKAIAYAESQLVCLMVYWNTEQTVHCPEGYEGDPVTVESGLFSSTISQEDANNKAIAYAESQLVCSFIYWNMQQIAHCPEGYEGESIVVAAGTFSSTISQEDANNKALAYAESQLVCDLITPEFVLGVYDRSADFELEGYPEYPELESTPPRYYYKEVYEGRMAASAWAPDWEMYGHIYSGEKVWPEIHGGVLTTFYGFYSDHSLPLPEDSRWEGINDPPSIVPDSYTYNTYVLTSEVPIYHGPSGTRSIIYGGLENRVSNEVFEPTLYKIIGKSEVIIDPDDNSSRGVAHGFLERKLIDEHEPCDAFEEILVSENPAWSIPVEYNEEEASNGSLQVGTEVIWLDDPNPRLWSGVQRKWKITVSNLAVGQDYEISWESQKNGIMTQIFTATDNTYEFEKIVDCGDVVSSWTVTRV